MKALTPTIKRRLDIQGFTETDPKVLEETAPWLGFPYGICAILAAIGTILASPVVLLSLTFFSAWAAASPVHPFDYIYNYGIRRVTGTGPFPKRGRTWTFCLRPGYSLACGNSLGVLLRDDAHRIYPGC